MKIGIDIDGTITTPFYWLDFYNTKLNKNIQAKDITSYAHQLAFDMTLKSFNTFRNKHIHEIHSLARPRHFAVQYVNQLYFRYKNIYIVTAREKHLETLTSNWLDTHKILYSSLHHLGSTDKSQLALENNLDVFIEDRLETAIDMIKWSIPTILFNTPYNQGYEHPLIYRIESWSEAFDVIRRLENQKKSQKLLKFLT